MFTQMGHLSVDAMMRVYHMIVFQIVAPSLPEGSPPPTLLMQNHPGFLNSDWSLCVCCCVCVALTMASLAWATIRQMTL